MHDTSSVRTDHVTGLTLLGVGTGAPAALLALSDRLPQLAWFLAGLTALLWVAALLAHAMVAHTELVLERLERLESLERATPGADDRGPEDVRS